MNLEAELAALRAALAERADSEYRAGSARVAPTAQDVLGVRTPEMRQVARSWMAAHKALAPAGVLAIAGALWDAGSRDERMVGLFMLERDKRALRDLTWDHFDRWRGDIDNWIVCDQLATKVFGPWITLDPGRRLPYLDLLIAEPGLYSRRLALVATVPLNRTAKTAIPAQTLAMIDRVRHERQAMISKAVSWALRELAKTHAAAVAAYLDAHRQELAGNVVREVANKLETGLKAGRSA